VKAASASPTGRCAVGRAPSQGASRSRVSCATRTITRGTASTRSASPTVSTSPSQRHRLNVTVDVSSTIDFANDPRNSQDLADATEFTTKIRVDSARFQRGDADQDPTFALTDAVVALRFIFQGGETPECIKAIDYDDSGSINVTDADGRLIYLFRDGSPASEPFEECGSDPPPDDLTCETSSACAS